MRLPSLAAAGAFHSWVAQGEARRFLPLLLYGLVLMLALVSLGMFGWSRTWAWLGIGAMEPVFADMRTVQAAVMAAAHDGMGNMLQAADPWGRPLNYPRIWVAIGQALGIGAETHFLAACIVLVAAFVACCAKLLQDHPSLPLLLALLSSSALLGIERGNNDLLVFVLLYVFALRLTGWAGLAAISVATLLKLYPLFALAGLAIARQWKRLLLAAAIALAAGLHFIDQIVSLKALAPVSIDMAYGLPGTLLLIGGDAFATAMFFAFLVLAAGAAYRLARHLPAPPPASMGQAYRLFLVGASIYCGTYLTASNYHYRAVFLALCIPFLRDAGGKYGWLLIGLILVTMNMDWLHHPRMLGLFIVDGFHPLTERLWFHLYRLPDHLAKGLLFSLLSGTLLQHLVRSRADVTKIVTRGR